MLRTLSIRDFVIVDQLELDFEGGFTVFSGETGAGKSILVDALAVVLGGRAEAIMVREGASRADLSARCEINEDVRAWLVEQSIDCDEDDVLLRRVIDTQGRSKNWINGTSVTLAQLRECAESLIDIYGQHAHQALLKRQAQRSLLDAQAGLSARVRELGELMSAWRDASARRERAEHDQRGVSERRDLLSSQLDELERLDCKPSEWQDIAAEHTRLSHAASLIEAAHAAVDLLQESDGALLTRLSPMISRLSQLEAHDERLKPVVEVLEPARIQLQEAVYALNHYLDHLELDPARLAHIEARLDAIHSLARKLRVAPEGLIELQTKLRVELDQLAASADLDGLKRTEETAKAAYHALAAEVRLRREQSAKELSAAVTQGMQMLSMQGGRFEVRVEPAEPSASGTEQIEFFVAGHGGVEARPLARIASGGELARISLAISVIASTAQATPTVIFDEVDAGIGGAVAEVVGRLLRQLSADCQVLCVTHLPQVAARAQHHFVVSKQGSADKTASQVRQLSRSERVDELARMLGGIEITSTTRRHAKEMLSLPD
jgi:DNA repair protein RecN (Recombination protein N)